MLLTTARFCVVLFCVICVFCLSVVLVGLSVPVQVIDCWLGDRMRIRTALAVLTSSLGSWPAPGLAWIHRHHHYHHEVARWDSIADSTIRHHDERSAARHNADWRPRLNGVRSRLIV